MDLFCFNSGARGVFSIALLLGGGAVFAQELPIIAAPKLKYTSVFSQYQAFKEQTVAPWRENNETVGKIGGWRVYAKEARAVDGDATAPPPKTEARDEHGRKP